MSLFHRRRVVTDPQVFEAFGAGVVVVVAAAAPAAYQPARRATRLDPSDALRADA